VVTLHFGSGEPADPPQVTLTMREQDARRLREGALEPQAAFLQGLVTISGDIGLAMQIGAGLFM
jgi:putative sterol carrier protein